MNLIEELIENLTQPNSSLSDALLKTKVLLFKLGQKELAEWVTCEIEGYNADKLVPEYRITTGHLKGTITNGFWTYQNQLLPTSHLSESLRDHFERKIEIREPISVLEMLGIEKKSLSFQPPIEINQLIGEALTDDAWILQSRCELGVGVPTRITTQVRSRLLDFLLELRDKFGSGATNSQIESAAKSMDVVSTFNNAIFGNNTTIVIGDNNRLSVKNSVVKDDFESLKKLLEANGITTEDTELLAKALADDKDSPELSEKKFGKSVSAWIGNALSKAASASWQIELSIAANLITDGLKAYYGWLN